MKIGIYNPYLDDIGGGEKYMLSIAEHLAKNNTVDIFWENKKDLEKVAERFSIDTSKLTLKENIFSPKIPFLKRLKESAGYDAIFVLSDGSIPVVLSKKLLVHFQQPFPNIGPDFKNNLKKIRVNSFFCNSNYTKRFIDKEFGINSRVLYPPVEIKAKNTKKENIILNVGRFRVWDVTTKTGTERKEIMDYKKQSVMVDVFKQMVDKGLKDWKFVLAVSVNEDESKIFKEFKKSTEGYPVEFLVNEKNNDLWDIYSKAKIYWHASGFGEDLDNHPEFAEHFGISTVEAMGAGAVPVVINAGGQKEIVENGKNGFLWDTLEELRSKTLELMSSKALMDKLSLRSKERAKDFSKDKFYQGISGMIL